MKESPRDQQENQRRITRRGLMLGASQLGFMGVLALRMRFMQVEQAEEFRLLAEENRINLRLIPPTRGLIYDRRGIELARNEQNYRIVMVREDVEDVDQTLAAIARLVPMSDEEIARARKEVMRRSPFVPVTITDRVTWEQLAEVAVNAPALPGITPERGLSREYPMGPDFAHVVGYVGPVSDYDLSKLENPDPVLQIPRFQIGKTGVETKLEDTLRGSAGTRRIEVNAVGRVIRELSRVEGQQGANLQLTVDAGLQNFMQARLQGESGAAVVIGLEKGDILGIASTPGFDPNKFVRGISVPDYRDLTENKYRPLASKTVQGTYPPGSTFKMVTALAALEAGVITPGEKVYCGGYTELGNRRFHCWRRGGHGHVDLNTSLQQSCDVYYYEIAQRVGIEKITQMARRLGLGQRHDLPLSAVAQGLTPTKAWKREKRGADWVVGDTLNASIGQGFVLASPLQLAVMTARLATGRAVTPRMVRSVNGVEQASGAGEDLGLAPSSLAHIQRGMFDVCNSGRGTAYGSRIIDDALKMAGKTGTSQVRNITAAERARGVFRNEDLPWERRDHALFVNYAPAENPTVAVAVVIEHGGGGSKAAAPVARDITLRALHQDLPPLEAYPAHQRREIEERFEAMDLMPPQPPSAKGRSRA